MGAADVGVEKLTLSVVCSSTRAVEYPATRIAEITWSATTGDPDFGSPCAAKLFGKRTVAASS